MEANGQLYIPAAFTVEERSYGTVFIIARYWTIFCTRILFTPLITYLFNMMMMISGASAQTGPWPPSRVS
jgi:hypothetical protein